MQKAKIQFIVIFSAILLRNGGQQSREKGRGADFEDFEETWKSGCTGTCFLLKGNNLALLCPALGGGHTREFVKKKSAIEVFESKNAFLKNALISVLLTKGKGLKTRMEEIDHKQHL